VVLSEEEEEEEGSSSGGDFSNEDESGSARTTFNDLDFFLIHAKTVTLNRRASLSRALAALTPLNF